MLSGLRQATRGWVAGIIIGLLAIAFAIFGINDVFRPAQRDAVASGDGVEISSAAFDQYLERALRQEREERGQFITKAQAREGGLDVQVLNELIALASLDRVAHKAGMRASDALIAQSIRETPAFKSQITGAFDLNTYRDTLARAQLTEKQFEDQQRLQIARLQLANGVAVGMRAPQSYGEFLFRFQTEQRTVSLAEITPARLPKPVPPTDAEIQAFYKEAEAQLRTPEYRAVSVVEASLAAFEAKVDIPEADLQSAYEAQKARLTPPEKRSFIEVSGTDEAAVRAAAQRLGAGEDAQKVAASLGLQALVIVDQQREQIQDPAVSVAVFGIKAVNGVSPAFKSASGFAVAKLSAITPGQTPSFAQARDQVRKEMARDQAQTLLTEAVDKFEDLRSGGQSLEEAAKGAGLGFIKLDAVDEAGALRAGGPALPEGAELMKAAFATAENETTEFVNTKDGDSRLARVEKVLPAGVRPLEEVRADIALAVTQRKLIEAMKAKAEKVVAETKAGKPFDVVIRAEGLNLVAGFQTLDRQMAMQGSLPQLGAAIFSAKEKETVYAPAPGGAPVLLVAHIERILLPDPKAAPEQLAKLRQAADGMLTNDIVAALRTSARNRAKVSINQQRLDAVMGVSAPEDAAAK